MTNDWREELVEAMARKIAMSRYKFADFNIAAREALAVAEPVIREQCAKKCDRRSINDGSLEDMEARRCAAAIREGGKE